MAESPSFVRDSAGTPHICLRDSDGGVIPYVDLVEAAPAWGWRIGNRAGPAYRALWEADDGCGGYAFTVYYQ